MKKTTADIEDIDDLFKLIVSMCAIGLELMGKEGMSGEQLRKAAELYLATAAFTYCEISHHFQGEALYIRKISGNRQYKIQRAFNGKNIDELIKIFKVSRATVYRAISKKTDEYQHDIVEMLVDGIFRRKSDPNPQATEFQNIESIYRRLSESKAFKPYFEVN